jgi:hypothetical protein
MRLTNDVGAVSLHEMVDAVQADEADEADEADDNEIDGDDVIQ